MERFRLLKETSTHPMPAIRKVKRWMLEFTASEELVRANCTEDVSIDWQQKLSNEQFLELYTRVGGPWNWFDRRMMAPAELTRLLQEPARAVGLLKSSTVGEVGFTETVCHSARDVEIAYFGLFPECIGGGLGTKLLTSVLKWAFDTIQKGNPRIWLTTCEWDSPAALPFYQRMGFQIRSEDVIEQRVPAGFDSPGIR